ncbi:hypothetical protein [Chryseobacterium sp. FH1]|uniref:hypothetical protein n=1 Tax=Chryseobacterium sp. FH1 TaxID=1233951 RepID=UPI0004E306E9|nr:hypothetical protein [Chryseobacterium sp. FH1]KFC20482.1 hypothetical protein IO90_15120 [Chryseobacterium sp. FH1]
MRKTTLRTLIAFSFTLFFLPFLKTCSNTHEVETIETTFLDSTGTFTESNDTIIAQKPVLEQEEKKCSEQENESIELNITKSDDSFTYSFYRLLLNTCGKAEYDTNPLFDKTFYPLLGYLTVFVSTVIMLIVSFFNRINTIKILTVINLSLLITSTILFYFCDVIRSMNQIKIGVYLIIIYFILIYIISRNILNNNQLV